MDARYRLNFKRRRNGKTNYKKRYDFLLSKEPRIAIRITNKQIIIQTIKYKLEGDETIAQATSKELTSFGWTQSQKNIPSAYLTGLLSAKRAVDKKIKSAIIDLGLHTAHKKGRIFAAVKGIIDSGIKISHDEKMLPGEERITGTHLKKDAAQEFQKVKENILKAKKSEQKPKGEPHTKHKKAASKTTAKKQGKKDKTSGKTNPKSKKEKENKK